MQWQSIKTAPKDGTEIVLWSERSEHLIYQARWDIKRECWEHYDLDMGDCFNWLRLGYEPSH